MAKKKASNNKKKTTAKQPNQPIVEQKKGIDGMSNLFLGLCLAVISIILYSNSFNHGFTVDDPLLITENKIVQKGISSIGEIWTSSYLQGYNSEVDAAYRPLSLTQFAIEKSIFGGKSGMMHFMHVLYYALGILLCYFFSLKLFKGNKLIAFITTLLYLAHPIHTEVVNNLKSRDEIMLMLGTMGMGYFYLKYLDKKESKALILALIFYFVALFSKETAVSFFLLIPLLYLWIQQVWNKEALVHGAYFLGISILYFLVRTVVVGTYDIEMDFMNNALLQGDGNILQRFPNAMLLMGKYLVMLFVPYPLSVDYSFDAIPLNGWSSVWTYLSLLTYGLMTFFAIKGIREKKIYGLLISWFLITIVVASNVIILIGSTFAERFLFVPSFAFCAGIGFALFHLLGKKSLIVAGIISIAAGSWTFVRNSHWKSDKTIFARDVHFQQNSARVQTFHGKFSYEDAKEKKGEEKEKGLLVAKTALDKAIAIAPDYMVGNYYRGFVAKEEADFDQAVTSFAKVVELEPSFKNARTQYGIALANKKNHEKAIEQYQWLLDNDVKDMTTINNIAYSYLQSGNYRKAEEFYLQAHAMDPKDENVLSNIVKLYRDGLKDIKTALKFNDKLKLLKK